MNKPKALKELDRVVLEAKFINKEGIRIWKRWRNLRAACIKEQPHCSVCGWDKRLEGHHIIPRHVAPNLALIKKNVIVLCKKCHFTIGHWCDFRDDYNRDIEYVASMVSNFRKKQRAD